MTLVQTAKLIAGEHSCAKTFGLSLGDNVEAFGERVSVAIQDSLAFSDVLVLTDIRAGSPFNVTLETASLHRFYHITGMNLPIVIEALGARDRMSLAEVFIDILNAGMESIVDVNQLLEDYDDF